MKRLPINIIQKLLTITFIALIAGCSSYQVNSNVDKDKFEDYFQPSTVTIYQKGQLEELEYTILGGVEGSSCQEKAKDIPADEREARTKARINAANMNANGITFQSCINFPQDAACVSNVICYGQALDVVPPE